MDSITPSDAQGYSWNVNMRTRTDCCERRQSSVELYEVDKITHIDMFWSKGHIC